MPRGTWQHTSASFKILLAPFLKALFILWRCCPCIEVTPVLACLWEAVRLSRTFRLSAGIRFLLLLYLTHASFFLFHCSRLLVSSLWVSFEPGSKSRYVPNDCWEGPLFVCWHSYYTEVRLRIRRQRELKPLQWKFKSKDDKEQFSWHLF